MKYQLYITTSRLPFLLNNGVVFNVIKVEGDKSFIEIEIVSAINLLDLFHAGISCGFETSVNSINKRA